MRTTILGMFGILWGGAIIVSGILERSDAPDPTHALGDLIALAFGGLILVAGARTLLRCLR